MTTEQQKAYRMIHLAMFLQESLLKALKHWWGKPKNQLKGLTEIEAINTESVWMDPS